ncbi:tyrosine phosphatase family-domain-containing protein [Lipomyces orientalis]|uniref:Tyrosine phosphatase family-domain-containing protein n=1 Tax=Lipomyces orientalis TaxID=1233043 RepID=A0ACC3TSP7_9ASCO
MTSATRRIVLERSQARTARDDEYERSTRRTETDCDHTEHNTEGISDHEEDNPPLLVTPLRYGIVQPKLYRGLYPRKINLPFLRRLKLKTILSLTPEPLEDEIAKFCNDEGIKMTHIKTSKSGKKGVPISYKEVTQAIEIIISQQHAPLYIHCLNGSQATSLVIACLRKLSFWRTSSILSEFMYYSEVSAADHKFVDEFKAEIQLPQDTVPWIWMGLSRKGIVENHPTVKIKNANNSPSIEAAAEAQEAESEQ